MKFSNIKNFFTITVNKKKIEKDKDKPKKVTVDDFIETQVKSLGDLPGLFTKEFLEDLIKQYPKLNHPNIIESDGKLKFIDINGHTAQLHIPLLTIIPIPYISKDSVDLNKYYEENFGHSNPPKNLEDIQGVQVNVPALNIIPVPQIKKDVLKDADLDFHNTKKSTKKKTK